MNAQIITINRQYGAYGRTVARGLSEALGINFYDRDFVMKTASTPEELAIERALLMFLETNSNRVDYTRNKGIALLADVLNNERVLDVFTHKYGLTQMSVYELSAGKSIEEVLGSDENRKS